MSCEPVIKKSKNLTLEEQIHEWTYEGCEMTNFCFAYDETGEDFNLHREMLDQARYNDRELILSPIRSNYPPEGWNNALCDYQNVNWVEFKKHFPNGHFFPINSLSNSEKRIMESSKLYGFYQ